MNRCIFKYEFPRGESRFVLTMPRGAQILSVGAQGTMLYLWAVVDEHERPEERIFRIVATGEAFDAECLKFIGHIRLQLDGTYTYELFVWEVDMGLERLILDTNEDHYPVNVAVGA